MGDSGIDHSQIGRYQIVSSGTESIHIFAVLDTATGKVWTKSITSHAFRKRHNELLETENQGKAFWEMSQ